VWPGIALALVQLALLAPVLITLGPEGDSYPDRVQVDLRDRVGAPA
jgi:hypothetical protein